jgi:hypothetical protein
MTLKRIEEFDEKENVHVDCRCGVDGPAHSRAKLGSPYFAI